MIKFINDNIPFGSYVAMTVWPIIFIKKEYRHKFDEVAENHENIHGEQQKEMLIAGAVIAGAMAFIGLGWWSLLALPMFFYWYGIEYIIRLVIYGFSHDNAYYNISFEQEAYLNQDDKYYIEKREMFAWLKYIFKRSFNK